MRTPVVAANWKMNKTIGEARSFVEAFLPLVSDVDDCTIVICPPFTALAAVGEMLKGTKIALGAQDMFWREQGAFTGEISPVMLTDVGCSFVIIGHSERRGRFGKPEPDLEDQSLRSVFGETDESVNKKVHAALSHGLTPIVCVGETLAEREQGLTDEIVSTQLKKALDGLTEEQASKVVIAYEPVWAIGTGKVCDAPEANRVCGLIRKIISDLFGEPVAQSVRIQYGGSITPDNIPDLAAQEHIDGGLVGGASLKPDSFAAIVKTVAQAKKQ
ncbi:MAG: triose-phosphate isomerase [Armatimonadetes bacterium]|nr:triose-phosphate isomerase [Armatimonadota bacterium]